MGMRAIVQILVGVVSGTVLWPRAASAERTPAGRVPPAARPCAPGHSAAGHRQSGRRAGRPDEHRSDQRRHTEPIPALRDPHDSITQGTASTANAFRGWLDRVAERLAPLHWAVVNAGIGGNRLLRYGLGPNILARLDRDVLSVPGLRAIIVMEGINDIGVGLRNDAGYKAMADAVELSLFT
jgi:hypothetical protein